MVEHCSKILAREEKAITIKQSNGAKDLPDSEQNLPNKVRARSRMARETKSLHRRTHTHTRLCCSK